MEPVAALAKVLHALNELQVPHMLVRALSSNMYGEPRFTNDADLVIDLGSTSIAQLAPKLGAELRLDTQLGFETITGRMRYQIQTVSSDYVIELFLLNDDSHNVMRFRRRRATKFAGVATCVQSAEDVVIQKLHWYQIAGREKDLSDVRGVIDTQGEALDLGYIRGWADQHGSREVFETLWAKRIEP